MPWFARWARLRPQKSARDNADMTKIRYNILANYMGQGWSIFINIAFVPLYIRYLGMEAYGLIGMFAVLQAWLTLLDMGMTPTLNREMARFLVVKGDSQNIQDLLRSLEILCLPITGGIVLAIWALSGFLAKDWLRVETIPLAQVSGAIGVMGLVVAGRFVESLYRSSLLGLQRQVFYNVANGLLSTVRAGGSVAVLALVSPTILAFFLWQGLCSLFSLCVLGIAVHKALPRPPRPARFSVAALINIRRFAGGMVGITLLSLMLTQVDKVLLSRLLPLAEFGYYTLAASLAAALYTLVSPITTATYPSLVEMATIQNERGLTQLYHKAAQLVTVSLAPPAAVLCIFAPEVMYVWTGNTAHALATASILPPLIIGSFLNAMMWMPYQCQLAYGWTSFALKANLIGTCLLIPAILWVTPHYGAPGAAWVWAALNIAYMLVGIPIMHKYILTSEKWTWYDRDVGRPLIAALLAVAAVRLAAHQQIHDRLLWLATLLLAGFLSFFAAVLASDITRQKLFEALSGWRSAWPIRALSRIIR